ncbi:MAG: hypothetical protein ABIN94_17435 [Ferruginibacter sp.]
MKRIFILTFFLSVIILSAHSQQKANVVCTHDFPPAMKEEVKKEYIKLFEKGRILYQINCSRCHNTKVNGVELMPEFTKEHLAKYELRIQNPQHEEELNETRVNAEELAQIMIFLTYYKPVKSKKGK